MIRLVPTLFPQQKESAVILRHATPAHNVRPIEQLGLLPGLARTATQVVWLHAPRLTHWAILHVARRHHVSPEDVHVLTCFVPRPWLRRHASGLWYCDQIIPSHRIAGSPAWYASAIIGTREECHQAVEEAVEEIRP